MLTCMLFHNEELIKPVSCVRVAISRWILTLQDRMYGQLVQSVVQEIKATIGQCNPTEPPATSSLFSFDVVRVAGDGKCFWRAILASQDIESFKLIPRTASFASQEMSKYVTIYIYVLT